MRKDILIFGGLGDYRSSVVGLYHQLLEQLSESFTLIAIDPKASSKSTDYTIDFYQHQYCDLDEYILQASQSSIAAVFVLTPVSSHLAIVEQVRQSCSISDTLFVIEKPSFSLDQIDLGFNQIIPSCQKVGAKFYFIDTTLVSLSMEYYFQHYFSKDNKKPFKINVISCDNPSQIIEPLAQFRFDNKRDTLNSRRLLDPKYSGGAGYGFDMGIHGLAGLTRYLQKAGLFDSELIVNKVTAEYLTDPMLERHPGCETHLYALAQLNHTPTNEKIALMLQAGKAGDIWDRRIELYFKDVTVVIGFGTLKYPPYLFIINKQEEWFKAFDIAGAGYKMHFNDILNALGFNTEAIISEQESEALMSRSMLYLHSIYDHLGKNLEQREQNMIGVNQHKHQFINEQEHSLRMTLSTILNNNILGV